MHDAGVLGEIPIREMHVRILRFGFVIDAPAHDAHLGGVSQASTFPLNVALLMRPMNEIVARFAERDQVIRTISPSFAALNVVNIEYPVF